MRDTMKQTLQNTLPALLLLAALLVQTGCVADGRRAIRAIHGADSKAFEEFPGDPVALATVKTIAVVPFEYVGTEPGFDAMAFSTQLATRLAMRGEVRVIYPRQVMDLAGRYNRVARDHNTQLQERALYGEDMDALSTEERTPMERMDPVRRMEDAVRLARELKADAVLTGLVTDYDPYMRPRLGLTMNAVATGNSETAAVALAEMTQWGVPRRMESSMGVVWRIQQMFDSREPDIGRNVYAFGTMKHTEEHPHNVSVYIRSMTRYFDYVSAVLTNAMMDARRAAIVEAEARALAEAERRRMAQEAARRRIRELTDPHVDLPDARVLMDMNLEDRREKGWRPDVHNLTHPDRRAILNERVDEEALREQMEQPRRSEPPPHAPRPEIRFE